MLILSTEHPHFARWQAFAQSLSLPIHTSDAQSEDSSFLPLTSTSSTALLALSAPALERALVAWCNADPAQRAPALLCIAHDADEASVRAAYQEQVKPTTLVGVDHNLAARETIAWSLAWGAAVPLFESRGEAQERGLLERARNAANVLQKVRKEIDSHDAWSLQESSKPAQESRAGFVHTGADALPRVMRELGHERADWVQASAERWSKWSPVFGGPQAQVVLRGQGALRINATNQRVRGTDVFYLRQIGDVRVRFLGTW